MTLREKILKDFPEDYFLRIELESPNFPLLPYLIVDKKDNGTFYLRWRLNTPNKIKHHRSIIERIFKTLPIKKRLILNWDREI